MSASGPEKKLSNALLVSACDWNEPDVPDSACAHCEALSWPKKLSIEEKYIWSSKVAAVWKPILVAESMLKRVRRSVEKIWTCSPGKRLSVYTRSPSTYSPAERSRCVRAM